MDKLDFFAAIDSIYKHLYENPEDLDKIIECIPAISPVKQKMVKMVALPILGQAIIKAKEIIK